MLWRIIFQANGKMPGPPLTAALVNVLFTPRFNLQHFICRDSAGDLSQTVLKLVSFMTWNIYGVQISLPCQICDNKRGDNFILIFTGLSYSWFLILWKAFSALSFKTSIVGLKLPEGCEYYTQIAVIIYYFYIFVFRLETKFG